MTGRIATLWRSELKGSQGSYEHSLTVDTVVGVRGDRRIGIRRIPGNMSSWARKLNFYVCANTPGMALERPRFVDGHLQKNYLDDLRKRLGIIPDAAVQYASQEYSLHDTQGAFVSFLNLASVAALSDYMGRTIDPLRFRMNVTLRDLKPFEELDWITTYPGTRIVRVGKIRFRLDDMCERCKAPDANPATGTYDADILAALYEIMRIRGYKSPQRGVKTVMGFYGQPLENGTLELGDELKL